MTAISSLHKEAANFVEMYLFALVAELKQWREGNKLPAPSRFRFLASLCSYMPDGADIQEAERLVVEASLRRVTDEPFLPEADFREVWERHYVEGEPSEVARHWFELGRRANSSKS